MRDGKNGKERRGNKNVVDGRDCRCCEGATVRTRRVYLSCFYRLARTSRGTQVRGRGRGRRRRRRRRRGREVNVELGGRRKDGRSGSAVRGTVRKVAAEGSAEGGRVTEPAGALRLCQPVLEEPWAPPEPHHARVVKTVAVTFVVEKRFFSHRRRR